MFRKLCFIVSFLGCSTSHDIHNVYIGFIRRSGEDLGQAVVENVLRREVAGPTPVLFQKIEQVVQKDDAAHYQRAVCKLLQKGAIVLISETTFPSFPVLSAYSNRFNVSLVSPALPETPQDPKAADLVARNAIGIRPTTYRAILDLVRSFGWQHIVYIYDDESGPEKVQIMFRLGYSVLRIHVAGWARVSSAEEATSYLRRLSSSSSSSCGVLLDVRPDLARDVLLRHVHDAALRPDTFRYLLARPTLENFWTLHKTELSVLSITGFLYHHPDFNGDKHKSLKRDWDKLSTNNGQYPRLHLNISNYYYHDAGLALATALSVFPSRFPPSILPPPADCFHPPDHATHAARFPQLIKRATATEGLTGHLQFEQREGGQGDRTNFSLTLVRSSSIGYQEFGAWSDTTGLRLTSPPRSRLPGVLPQISDGKKLIITTIISPPYLMWKPNASALVGNARFEGFCVDVAESLCALIGEECELTLVQDNEYGRYVPAEGRWTGMVGEVIQGRADLALADLAITGKRQRVLHFSDPFAMVSLGVVAQHPDAVAAESSMFFVGHAFSASVWTCIVVAWVAFCLALHLITTYTGAPDSMESASGIWGRKNNIIMNVWFAVGTSLLQGTGVYPRSLSSRLLSGAWWFATLLLGCLLVASLTAQQDRQGGRSQLGALQSLSLESLLTESLRNGWPKAGLLYPSHTAQYLMQSRVPLFRQYAAWVAESPDGRVASVEAGVARVRSASGGFVLLLASPSGEYASRQEPCDLVSIPDSFTFAGYGIATSLRSEYSLKINKALGQLQQRGELGHLHRKWWIESNQCHTGFKRTSSQGLVYSFSGIFIMLAGGFCILSVVFVIQYFRKVQNRENRRQQLTFDDLNRGHRLPTPPPEILVPVPVEHSTRL